MEGWIKLHRKIQKWEWYVTPNMFHLFMHLILTANFEDSKWQGIIIKKGQRIFGYRKLAQETGISVQTIRTCINKLKSTHEITIKSTHQYSIVTICKYDEYQLSENEVNTQTNTQINTRLTHDQHTTNTTLRNKEEKEEKEEEYVSPKNSVPKNEKNIIPPTIKMVTLYCKERNNNITPRKFIDFYESKDWMIGKNKMKDWQAAIRTWEQSREFKNNGNGNKRSNYEKAGEYLAKRFGHTNN